MPASIVPLTYRLWLLCAMSSGSELLSTSRLDYCNSMLAGLLQSTIALCRRWTSYCHGYAPSSVSAPSHMPARLRGILYPRTWCGCHWSWTVQKQLKTHFFTLAFEVCWYVDDVWLCNCNAPMSYHCNRHTVNLTMMMMMDRNWHGSTTSNDYDELAVLSV